MMLDALIKENGIKISTDKVEFIKDLIQGESRMSLHHDPPEKPFLFEIVANKANGIDVDKWDYLARDSKMVGETCPLVATRLLEAARVVDGRIAYNWKDSHSINELFYARYSLHKKIYNHKVARAIEHMIVEALIAAEPVYHMADKIDDPSEYLLLTDSILEEIERSKDPRLEESRRIIRDLRRRKIPHRVEEKCVHADYRSLWKERLTPAAVAAMAREIAGHTNPNFKEILPRTKLSDGETTSADTVITDVASPTTDVATPDPIPGTPASMDPDTPDDSNEEEDFSNVPVTEKDVIVDFCLLHYGMKEKDPLGLVPCYGKNDPYHCSFIRPSESGSLKPRNFQELVVRCYARHRSQGKIIQAAFRKVMEKLPVIEDESNVASIVADRSSTPLAIQSPGSSFTVVDAPITPKPTKVEKVNSEVTAPNTFMTVTRSGGSPRKKSNKRKEEDREFPAEPDSPLRKRSKR
ncbi:hypothetical protein FRC02_004243 [Tulasnella sp. 418]|nr:hypothetical protein FRC02_004243 [Tulasnella sp. 418]